MAFRSVGTGTTATSGAPTTNAPAGVAAGDIVLQFLWTNAQTLAITWASGFTLVAEANGAAPNRDNGKSQLHVAWKLATGSEPGTYVNSSAAAQWMGFAACWSGRNTTSPITASATTAAAGTTSPVTYALTGVTAASGDDLIWFPGEFGSIAGTAVWTPPSGFTSQISYQPGGTTSPAQNLSTKDGVSAGATGTLTGTETGQDGDVTGIVIALAVGTAQAPVGAPISRGRGPGRSPGKTGARFQQFKLATSTGTTVQGSGVSLGSAVGAGSLTGAGVLAGVSISLSTTVGSELGAEGFSGVSFGLSVGTGNLLGKGILSGVSFGTSTPVGAVLGSGILAGTSVSTSTALGSILGAGALSGVSISATLGTGLAQDAGSTIAASGVSISSAIGAGALLGSGVLSGTSVAGSLGTGALLGNGILAGVSSSTSVAVGSALGAGALGGVSLSTSLGIGDLQSLPAGAVYGVSASTSLGIGDLKATAILAGVSVSGALSVAMLLDASAPVVPVTVGEVPAGRRTRQRPQRYIVRVDSQEFVCFSEAEALDVLRRAREAAALFSLEQIEKAAAVALKTQSQPVLPTLEPPRITVNSRDLRSAVSQTRREIAQTYRQAEIDAEIKMLFELKKRSDDDEDSLMLLM